LAMVLSLLVAPALAQTQNSKSWREFRYGDHN